MRLSIYLFILFSFLSLSNECLAKETLSGINPEEFNYLTRPQDSLYNHINSDWLNNTPIPDDQIGWGSYMTLREESYVNQKGLIEGIIKKISQNDSSLTSEEIKIANLYKSYMDRDRINKLGHQPINEDIKRILKIKDTKDLWDYFAYSVRSGPSVPFTIAIYDDLKDPLNYTVYIDQSGLGLPDRDYYLEDNYKDAREAYLTHIENLLKLAGIEKEKKKASNAYEVEKRLAKIQLSRTDSRDPEKIYNPFTLEQLSNLGSGEWESWVTSLGLKSQKKFIVESPDYIKSVLELMTDVPIEQWIDYLLVRMVKGSSSSLSDEFVNESFRFAKILTGREKLPDLWKRGVGLSNGLMGDAIGKIYIKKYFPPEYKVRMEVLVNNLLESFKVGIEDLSWMTDQTKIKALEKLSKLNVKIGYPEIWDDYDGLSVDPEDLYGNLQNASVFGYKKALEKLSGPVDRREWSMSPQTVNAYFSPTKNEIVFPAAYLQPPNFNPNADDAVNYGAIGVTIGHEISHAFDDKGSQFDGDGNLNNWWTEEDRRNFDERTQKLVKQYSEYEAVPGIRLNGELTLGENIADLGGAKAAFRAYKILSLIHI